MNVHIGHHFWGAGNLGDDLMLAGFQHLLHKWETLNRQPDSLLTCCTPFDRDSLSARFPNVRWLPYDLQTRRQAIQDCDVWLGLGGSPFQILNSRWFVEHLEAELAFASEYDRPMFFLGVGVQDVEALDDPIMRNVCKRAVSFWTRDRKSFERLQQTGARVCEGADLAHAFMGTLHDFRDSGVPLSGTSVTLNLAGHHVGDLDLIVRRLADDTDGPHCWIAQEVRPLPNAERDLHARLTPSTRSRWSLAFVRHIGEWPACSLLISCRLHSAIIGAWSGARISLIGIDEKLKGAADELGLRRATEPALMRETIDQLISGATRVSANRLGELAHLAESSCFSCLDAMADSVKTGRRTRFSC